MERSPLVSFIFHVLFGVRRARFPLQPACPRRSISSFPFFVSPVSSVLAFCFLQEAISISSFASSFFLFSTSPSLVLYRTPSLLFVPQTFLPSLTSVFLSFDTSSRFSFDFRLHLVSAHRRFLHSSVVSFSLLQGTLSSRFFDGHRERARARFVSQSSRQQADSESHAD